MAAELEAFDCWETMRKGTIMNKLSAQIGWKGRRLRKKTFTLDEKSVAISYEPTKKKHIRYEVAQMTEVLTGDILQEAIGEMSKKYSLDRCISIKFGENNSLDMIASSPEVAHVWIHGLKTLMENQNNNKKDGALRQRWLVDAFEKFDKNKDGSLSLHEVTKLLNGLNINMSPKTIKKKFKDADTGNEDASLDKEEFAEFFKSIATRKEIVEIMETYPNRTHMDAREFHTFLEGKQRMTDVSTRYCKDIIFEYEPTKEGKEAHHLGIDGLRDYLMSREGSVFNPNHDKVYQDMTQPLSHYFIASSHNSYLMMDQLRGPSSVEAYINAFKKGCRCVELDCWDGENGEPIVYHGHTLTSKIKFKDIIEAVKEYAFKVSDYPVILSLENHCNIENQKTMAAHLENILGDMLFKEPVDDSLSALPSPESLKNKILIKGKKLKPEQENESDEEEGDVSDEDEASEIHPEALAAAEKENQDGGEGTSAHAAVTPDKISKEKERTKRSNSLRYSFRAVGKAVRRVKKPRDKEHKAKTKVKLAKELSRCVNYITSVGFKDFEHSKKNAKYYHMSSFVESKMSHLAHNHCAAFIEYNKRQLSRTYPAGNRVDSSNYNPQLAWNAGCQIVALNYQTDGEMMHINQGRFRQNGRAGYVLKPEFMRDSTSVDFNPKTPPIALRKLLKIRVISGQQLPKPVGESSKGEVIDPYVEVKIYGFPIDQGTFRSKVIKDNGFNPEFDLQVEKVIHVPELSMIRFAVFDEDVGKDDFIGQLCFPFTSLQTGYRHVPLLNMKGEPIPHATIFVEVSISDASSLKLAKYIKENKQRRKR